MRLLARLLLIREGEGKLVIHLLFLTALLGFAMAIGRSSSDALFFKRFGVEYLPQMFFFTSILLALFSALYASYADRITSMRMFHLVLGTTAAAVAASWLVMQASSSAWPFAVYYLVFAVASELIIIHTSLYMSGRLDAIQAKRILPLASAGTRLGAIAGGSAVGLTGGVLPVEHMAMAWVASLLLTLLALRTGGAAAANLSSPKKGASALADIRDGLRFASKSSLLRTGGISLFLMVVLISWQDYATSVILTRHFADENALAAFFGWFFAVTNLAVLILQLAVTNRLIQRYGIKLVSLIFPITTLFSFALLAASASLVPALVARFNYTGILHAFRNPAANLHFIALPNYMQGRARAINTGLILPLGLAVAGLTLLLAETLEPEAVALAGVSGSFGYVAVKLAKHRSYKRALIGLVEQQVFSGRGEELLELGRPDDGVIDAVFNELRAQADEPAFEFAADLFLRLSPEHTGPHVLALLDGLSVAARDRLLSRIAAARVPGWQTFAYSALEHGDAHLRATALMLLANHDKNVERQVGSWLHAESARLRAAAAVIAVGQRSQLAAEGRATLLAMLGAARRDEILAALPFAVELPEARSVLTRLLDHPDEAIRARSLEALCALCADSPQLRMAIPLAVEDPAARVRAAAVRSAAALTDVPQRLEILARAIDDPDASVRFAAESGAMALMPETADDFDASLLTYRNHFGMHELICRCLAARNLESRDELLAREAREHVRRAQIKRAACRFVDASATHALELLDLVLQEESLRHIDAALRILQLLGERDAVGAIRAALASRDSKLRAQAIESLNYLRYDDVVKEIVPLLEQPVTPAGKRAASADSVASVRQCLPIASDWLRQCLEYAGLAAGVRA